MNQFCNHRYIPFGNELRRGFCLQAHENPQNSFFVLGNPYQRLSSHLRTLFVAVPRAEVRTMIHSQQKRQAQDLSFSLAENQRFELWNRVTGYTISNPYRACEIMQLFRAHENDSRNGIKNAPVSGLAKAHFFRPHFGAKIFGTCGKILHRIKTVEC